MDVAQTLICPKCWCAYFDQEAHDVRCKALDTSPQQAEIVRTFTTGANRDTDDGKLDFDGFLSPLVIGRFAVYMDHNRRLKDGSIRDSDNWQKGMPLDVYMKSMWRHFFDVWSIHRCGSAPRDTTLEEALCGLLFNVQGYLHETIKARGNTCE